MAESGDIFLAVDTKAQGRPFDITASNQLWQTDMTSVWCGEDGWCYFTAVVDC